MSGRISDPRMGPYPPRDAMAVLLYVRTPALQNLAFVTTTAFLCSYKICVCSVT